MIVLRTDRAELHSFPTPEAVPGGYAILSHVWDESEQTFKDVQKITKRCKESGTNPRDHVSKKIRECCILAEKHGYDWIWNDTCCIDKRSSTELSEAINSMFHYYSLAKVCYAYLRDVPSNDNPHTRRSAFRKSRWHRRGWTLQELIAPVWLIFVAQDWRPLSGRAELADVLQTITSIPAPLLRLETKVSDYSVAQRMSWAARRETTRVEDRAYSLMGLFGIHMSTLYAEGEKAFRRLQEEIMKQSVDPSLFLWGPIWSLDGGLTEEDIPSACDHDDPESYLLATSPDKFRRCADVAYHPFDALSVTASQTTKPTTESPIITGRSYATILSERLPTFAYTPYGVHAHIPVVKMKRSGGRHLAILPCFLDQTPLGLSLSPCMRSPDPSRPLYHTVGSSFGRVVAINDRQLLRSWSVVIEWKEVYITPWPPFQQAQNLRLTLPINNMFSPPFRISEASMHRLDQKFYHIHTVSPVSPMWTGTPHFTVVFRQTLLHKHGFIAICLGRCESRPKNAGRREPRPLGAHWAAITFYTSQDHAYNSQSLAHVCADDHICHWPDSMKRVQDPYLSDLSQSVDWLLSFTPCRVNSDITLVANIELVETNRRI